MNGIERIIKEREDQIIKHNYTIDYDKEKQNNYQFNQAITVLIGFLNLDSETPEFITFSDGTCPENWDKIVWRKMLSKSYIERVQIAGALCAAEIDRVL